MYENFAGFYNTYTGDVNCGQLMDFLEERFRLFGNEGLKALAKKRSKGRTAKGGDASKTAKASKPEASENGADIEKSTLVIDVGCGTGKLTVKMAEKGYDMTGLDISPEMLEIASELGYEKNVNVLWLCQDMREMDTFGSYAAMYCLEDGVNHMTGEGDLGVFLERAKNFIDRDGLLIFDFLTDGYFKAAASKGVFFEDGGEGTCIWTAEYENAKMTYDIICYSLEEDGLYGRTDDTVEEIPLEPAFVKQTLQEKGYEVLELRECYDSPGRFYVTARRK